MIITINELLCISLGNLLSGINYSKSNISLDAKMTGNENFLTALLQQSITQ